jgi:hypothetical protein
MRQSREVQPVTMGIWEPLEHAPKIEHLTYVGHTKEGISIYDTTFGLVRNMPFPMEDVWQLLIEVELTAPLN